jgi:hypothetical protein
MGKPDVANIYLVRTPRCGVRSAQRAGLASEFKRQTPAPLVFSSPAIAARYASKLLAPRLLRLKCATGETSGEKIF